MVFIILTVFVIVVNINTVDFMYFEIQTTENQSKVGLSNEAIDYYTQQNNSSTMNPCQTGNFNHENKLISDFYDLKMNIVCLMFVIWFFSKYSVDDLPCLLYEPSHILSFLSDLEWHCCCYSCICCENSHYQYQKIYMPVRV